jgi:hypothetical protein
MERHARNTPHPLPPCGGGSGRGVNTRLSTRRLDPSQASLAARSAVRSFAISPARRERGARVEIAASPLPRKERPARNTTRPLPPCGGGSGRGVNTHLSTRRLDPSQASLAARFADHSFAISPGRGERGARVEIAASPLPRKERPARNTTRPLPPCGGGLGRGVNTDLSTGRLDPSQASLAARFADHSFAISPARGERSTVRIFQ